MNDLFLKQSANAKKHPFLYHYTKIDSLECILANNSLRASRLDIVNDKEENERITSLWNEKSRVF